MLRIKKKLVMEQWLTFGCAIHCLLTPVCIVLIPTFGRLFDNHWVELGFLGVSLIAGVSVVYHGYCRHKKLHTFYLFAVGALFWLFHLLVGHHDHVAVEMGCLLVGTFFVMGSYYVNHHYLKCCPNQICKGCH